VRSNERKIHLQLKSIEWLQKHRKKQPQSLWGAERVTPIKTEFRHIETSNEYALRTPDEIEVNKELLP
jgi:hypothetical protein